jgi:hypothetical protein
VGGLAVGWVRESTLPTEPAGKFDYRYRSLRLLIQAGGRLFRVPEHWTAQGRTLIVPCDDAVRLQVFLGQEPDLPVVPAIVPERFDCSASLFRAPRGTLRAPR